LLREVVPIGRAFHRKFLQSLAKGFNRLLQRLRAALPLAKLPKCVAKIILRYGPLERNSLAGIFLQSFAKGFNRLLQRLCAALALAERRKRIAEKIERCSAFIAIL
jgi:hypothetical protein